MPVTESSQTFFVTGATGYLGSNLVRTLIARGHRVFCLRRKTSNLVRLQSLEAQIGWVELETLNPREFFTHTNIDCIIHCATDYGRKVVDPSQIVEANLMLPLKLLQGAANCGVPVFINTDTILDKGINNYSLSKAQFAEWLASYSDKIVGVNLALEHFYGPGDDPTKFTTYIIQSLLAGQDCIKLTAGAQKRDFIYVEDVVEAILSIAALAGSMQRAYYRFEVGSGRSVTIREFVDLVKTLSGNSTTLLDYGALPYRKGEVMETVPDITGITALGWRAQTSLEDGLKKTILMEREASGLCAI